MNIQKVKELERKVRVKELKRKVQESKMLSEEEIEYYKQPFWYTTKGFSSYVPLTEEVKNGS